MLMFLKLHMLMFLRLHMLMIFTLQTYSMLFVGVEWYDSSPPQPLDPWRGRPPKRRSEGRMMRF